MTTPDLIPEWRSHARVFREYESDSVAAALEKCADQLEEALSEEGEVTFTLQEAATESGYTAGHLGRMVRERRIPNAGQPGSPLIARKDLPRKPDVAPDSVGTQIDRAQIVRSIAEAGV